MPEGWEKPKPNTGTQGVFWSRVHSKAQDYGDGAGYFRIEKTPVKGKRGGKRTGAGRKPRTVER